jgi:hypothetical protein
VQTTPEVAVNHLPVAGFVTGGKCAPAAPEKSATKDARASNSERKQRFMTSTPETISKLRRSRMGQAHQRIAKTGGIAQFSASSSCAESDRECLTLSSSSKPQCANIPTCASNQKLIGLVSLNMSRIGAKGLFLFMTFIYDAVVRHNWLDS